MQELISLFLHGGFGHSSYVGHRGGGEKNKKFCSILQSTLEASICKLTWRQNGDIVHGWVADEDSMDRPSITSSSLDKILTLCHVQISPRHDRLTTQPHTRVHTQHTHGDNGDSDAQVSADGRLLPSQVFLMSPRSVLLFRDENGLSSPSNSLHTFNSSWRVSFEIRCPPSGVTRGPAKCAWGLLGPREVKIRVTAAVLW